MESALVKLIRKMFFFFFRKQSKMVKKKQNSSTKKRTNVESHKKFTIKQNGDFSLNSLRWSRYYLHEKGINNETWNAFSTNKIQKRKQITPRKRREKQMRRRKNPKLLAKFSSIKFFVRCCFLFAIRCNSLRNFATKFLNIVFELII